MKKSVTREELLFTGEIWYSRCKRLVAASYDLSKTQEYQQKAFRLSRIMTLRVSNVAIALQKFNQLDLSKFQKGGIFNSL